jgi:hypothetical protein
MSDQQTHVILNPVRTDRAEEFERFLRETVVPAVRARSPELDGRWHVLRATEPDGDGVVTYVFLFDGGDLDDDWDLGTLLPAHYGTEEGERLLDEWLGTFAPRSEWAGLLADEDDDGPQVGWTLTPVL